MRNCFKVCQREKGFVWSVMRTLVHHLMDFRPSLFSYPYSTSPKAWHAMEGCMQGCQMIFQELSSTTKPRRCWAVLPQRYKSTRSLGMSPGNVVATSLCDIPATLPRNIPQHHRLATSLATTPIRCGASFYFGFPWLFGSRNFVQNFSEGVAHLIWPHGTNKQTNKHDMGAHVSACGWLNSVFI